MSKTNMDLNYYLEKKTNIVNGIYIYIYITCSHPTPMLQKMGPHNGKEFADFGVYKAWQFSKYNVRRDTIFEVETFMGTHQVNAVGDATSHDPSRSQLASYHKASFSSGLLVGEILSLSLRHLWARIRSQDVRRVPFGRLLRS